MKAFEPQAWHMVMFFITIVIGIFKNEIIAVLNSISNVGAKAYTKGQKIQILSPAGTWEDATVLNYSYMIPFKQGGGVTIRVNDSAGHVYQEKLSFARWRQLRTRHIDTTAK